MVAGRDCTADGRVYTAAGTACSRVAGTACTAAGKEHRFAGKESCRVNSNHETIGTGPDNDFGAANVRECRAARSRRHRQRHRPSRKEQPSRAEPGSLPPA